MGWYKQHMIEVQDRGYSDINKDVCSKCVGDIVLKTFVQEGGSRGKCDYCGKCGQVIATEDLLQEVMDGIGYEYERAVDSMGYDGREGGYIGAPTYDNDDMVMIIEEEAEITNDKLIEDIKNALNEETWCKYDPYGPFESSAYMSLWETFCNQVKYITRYIFFEVQGNTDEELGMEPYEILKYISSLAETFDLIIDIPENKKFFRGRTHDTKLNYGEEDLSSPPILKAKANRMSAEGISVFYGAEDPETVLAEISDGKLYATVAPCLNTTQLKLLDLTKVVDYPFPSLFDHDKRELREPCHFFKKLNEDLKRPIESMARVEYVPAQILTEYFRYVYEINGQHIDGIKYNSSKRNEGVCYVLFFDHSQCLSSSNLQKLKIIESDKKIYDMTVKDTLKI